MRSNSRYGWLALLLLLTLALIITTLTALKPLPDLATSDPITKPQLLDRFGRPITITYQNRWNLHDAVALHQVPDLLRTAFVISEDKRFFAHGGIDWSARFSACWQNLKARRAVRGASTITEQVVRMLHPRPRTLWSRWIEGFEARRLEAKHSKAAILEFYLNQVPYAAQRRGVLQAARYYFDRNLNTLGIKETLALAIMVRAPAHLNVHKDSAEVDRATMRLALRMRQTGGLSVQQFAAAQVDGLDPSLSGWSVDAQHFARFVYEQAGKTSAAVHTTLDLDLQYTAQQILDQQLKFLRPRHVKNAALLVVDNLSNEVLAWVVGASNKSDADANAYDTVRTARQPGSTLKPFVYALALNRDWTPATLIDDSPLSESVGFGLHTYHNYSRNHYGNVSLREALANSLNVPAVKAIQYVGAKEFLNTLHALGIQSLNQHPNVYGDGLALGNGEITLYELVQAYAVLARNGIFTSLKVLQTQAGWQEDHRVFSEEISSLMGHMLSDQDARRLEFGDGSMLDLPAQTAIKTGTSSDYRDAWAVGYNYRHTIGVWMGNLDNLPMNEVSGSTGPALVLRSVFAELTRYQNPQPLHFSRRLVRQTVCIESGLLSDGRCAGREEWFLPGQLPAKYIETTGPLRIRRPGNGLQLAMDPRIPNTREAFEFQLTHDEDILGVDWILNGHLIASTPSSNYLWPLQRGKHSLQARIWLSRQSHPVISRIVNFVVQ
ncbi:MAG: penicillin-binding protein 1C [Gammaproteobacteria bacterium]|nr:penicillin-binding protein 1C [Gammaproteobacteria bacterium]